MSNIILFGDSLFGRFGRDHILHLESLLEESMVHNCAAGGFDTREGLRRAPYIAQLKANVVCLSFGANDASPLKRAPVPISEFKTNLTAIIAAFAGSKIVLFPCPPVYNKDDVPGSGEFNALLAPYTEVIKEVAHTTNASLIDSEKVYGALRDRGEIYHIEDGLHLNDLGYSVLVTELAHAIRGR